MILTAAPYRVSLFGGGSDYPEHFEKHGGAVLGMAINRYCHVGLKRLLPFYDFKYRIAYQVVEDCKSIDEIKHPAVRGVLQYLAGDEGLEVHHAGDIPARTGLGASSSFVVAMIHACHALERRTISQRELADEAIYVERNVIREAVGCQDQTFAAYGGLNYISFHGPRKVERLLISEERVEEIESALVLCYTGTMRSAHEMAGRQIEAMPSNANILNELAQTASIARDIIQDEATNLNELGRLLDTTWEMKRSLCRGMSTADIDSLYAKGLAHGAIGGKLLGAGGGGFVLFFVPKDNRHGFERRMGGLCLTFKIDRRGSHLVINQP